MPTSRRARSSPSSTVTSSASPRPRRPSPSRSRNRWRRQRTPEAIREEIAPNNIILIGPTGVGKTEIARRLAKLAGAPFIKVEASKFTEVGYVGRDVESMVRDLVESAIDMVRHEREAEVDDLANDRVDDRILDLLLPPPTDAQIAQAGDPRSRVRRVEPGRRDGGRRRRARASQAHARQARAAHGRRPARGSAKSRSRSRSSRRSCIDLMGQQGAGEGMGNLGEMLSELMPKKKKKRTVTVADARRILLDEEIRRSSINFDDVVTDALERVEKLGIIFLDEIDEIAGTRGEGGGPDVSREGVQRDLLPIVEGSNVQTKYGMVKTDHVLFVAAGAFHVSKPSDLIPELQGRFPIRVELKPLTEADFVRIMTEPENALTKQYAALIAAEGVVLDHHRRRHRRGRAHRRAGELAHGEHRRAKAPHRHDHAARGRHVRTPRPRHRPREYRRQGGARSPQGHRRGRRPEEVHLVDAASASPDGRSPHAGIALSRIPHPTPASRSRTFTDERSATPTAISSPSPISRGMS